MSDTPVMTADEVASLTKHAAALPGGYTVAILGGEGLPSAAVTPTDLTRSPVFMFLSFGAGQGVRFLVRWTDGTTAGAAYGDMETAAARMPDFVFPGGGDQFHLDTPEHDGDRLN